MHVIVHPVIKRSLWSLNTPNDSIPVESLLATTTQREEDLMELCVLKILYCRLSSADICFCKPLSICSFIMYVYEVVLLLTQFKENPSSLVCDGFSEDSEAGSSKFPVMLKLSLTLFPHLSFWDLKMHYQF